MGQDVHAVLAYGVDCGVEESIWADEEVQEEVEDGGDIMEVVVKREGLVSPFDQIPVEIENLYYREREQYDQWKAENLPNFDKEWDAWWEAKKKLEEACPLEVKSYGGDGFMSYVLAIKGFTFDGGWERTIRLDLPRLAVPDKATLEACAAYAEKYGLKWDAPTWLLFGGFL